jgi:D-alanyl-D-alanine endopeptidase (penicillin-binding protein 7)
MHDKNVFGPQRPEDRFSILLKILTGTLVFVIILFITFLFQKLKLSDELKEVSLVFEAMDSISIEDVKAGGDVIIEPIEKEKPDQRLPELIGELKLEDEFTSKSIIVKDKETGLVLYRKNEYDVRSIASITKLMSALIMLEKKPDWSAKVEVVGGDSLGTHMYAGDTYTLDELWHSALIGSSNKAILSLAKALDWPLEAFVERMNQKARELGMSQTSFVEPTGLDEGNKSNASDLVLLLEEAMKQNKIREALLTTEYNLYSEERGKKHHMWNTNWLLLGWVTHDLEKIFGGKTGYTNAAGYSFVTQVGNEKNNVINIVVLGAREHEDRFTEAAEVAKTVFENYIWPEDI